jgi:hypothetical protein
MVISVLHSQIFQISNYHFLSEIGIFFSINTCMYICAQNQGVHTSLKKKMIFWKQIRMSLVLVYNWHETAVFTKYKHIILKWINSLKYNAWQLSFQNVKNVSVKSKFYLEIHYPLSSQWKLLFMIHAM